MKSASSKRYDIDYMERTRLYYRAMGYETDYQWAHFESVPFTVPARPVRESRLAVITTAMASDADASQRQLAAYPSNPIPASLLTDHLSWDKDNTHTRDVPSFLPLEQINRLVEEGFVGSPGPRFYCLPTEYSKRTTMKEDAPGVLELCRQDRVDLALLVPL
ncbi:MAG: hypothetical protein R3F41_18035 [Gammaproteobacteria bacterium]|nr:hypothetical protein [Pseudomonadales bacterium]